MRLSSLIAASGLLLSSHISVAAELTPYQAEARAGIFSHQSSEVGDGSLYRRQPLETRNINRAS
jgi:hypothetical protein